MTYSWCPISDPFPEGWFTPVTHIPEGYWLALCMLKYQQMGIFK